jgi:hypothetical protein
MTNILKQFLKILGIFLDNMLTVLTIMSALDLFFFYEILQLYSKDEFSPN